MGHEVRLIDLTRIKFSPYGGPQDFKALKNPERFDYVAEQNSAMEKDNFAKDVQDQIDNLKWCDVVIHVFPLYRFSCPAIHKGYLDRVMAYNKLNGKKWMIATTAGQPKSSFSKEGVWGETVETLLYHLNVNCAKFLGMETLKMFVAYEVNDINQSQRDKIVNEWINHLKSYFENK